MWKLVALLLAWSVASVTMSVADETLFDLATGYRIAHYRSPTPESVPGGTRIMAADVPELIAGQHAILIDVMPSEGARPEPKSGQWYLLKSHQNIAGSTWLADVGHGVLNPDQSRYFTENLARLTHGDVSRAVIFYCKADCWMAWNAVRRAAAFGYQNIYWLSEGTDGWTDWGGDLVDAKPEPFPEVHQKSSNSAAKP